MCARIVVDRTGVAYANGNIEILAKAIMGE